MPLTAREKSTNKILKDSFNNFKKKLIKTESNNTLISFRKKKEYFDENTHNSVLSNTKLDKIIFDGFNNNNIIKKFNISLNNNNITNINSKESDTHNPLNSLSNPKNKSFGQNDNNQNSESDKIPSGN